MSCQPGDDPERLGIAFETVPLPSFNNRLKYYFLSVVAERRMPQVVSKARRFNNIRIQAAPSFTFRWVFFQQAFR